MPDETTAALQEIAQLLRRRVEQTDEAAERGGNFRRRSAGNPWTDDVQSQIDESKNRTAKMLDYREQEKQNRERLLEEDRQFKARLLTELERHNSLLERIAAQLEA